ncbi:MAG: Peptidase M23 [Parcubacteria group bacterium GW2011_GWA2_36_10]|nr:MAG: Peptidase M23 [Parcubacteria group bacterium GW2011_GWA2_36_10]
MKNPKYLVFILILAIMAFFAGKVLLFANSEESARQAAVKVSPDNEVVVNIESGMTFSDITEAAGVSSSTQELLAATKDVYDLARIKAGKSILFYFDKQTGDFHKMIYQTNSETELILNKVSDIWQAELKTIDYEVRIKIASGTITSSFYQSALDQHIDERAIIELADVFAWTVDFGMGIREGDTYKFIYEERYRDGEYVIPGKILAAVFNNDGQEKEGYYFKEGVDADGSEIDGYYNFTGESLQKMFLKNPVNFRYISSGFTTGRRYVEAFNVATGHRAIDYAAAIGTPIRAIGDGVVTNAGWSRAGYGNLTSIRHNSTYSSNYAHQSKIYVKVGTKVKQGDVIGAVGSTGFSTGPHLHFEIVQNGTKINPLTLDMPSEKNLSKDKIAEFLESIKDWQKQLHE